MAKLYYGPALPVCTSIVICFNTLLYRLGLVLDDGDGGIWHVIGVVDGLQNINDLCQPVALLFVFLRCSSFLP